DRPVDRRRSCRRGRCAGLSFRPRPAHRRRRLRDPAGRWGPPVRLPPPPGSPGPLRGGDGAARTGARSRAGGHGGRDPGQRARRGPAAGDAHRRSVATRLGPRRRGPDAHRGRWRPSRLAARRRGRHRPLASERARRPGRHQVDLLRGERRGPGPCPRQRRRRGHLRQPGRQPVRRDGHQRVRRRGGPAGDASPCRRLPGRSDPRAGDGAGRRGRGRPSHRGARLSGGGLRHLQHARRATHPCRRRAAAARVPGPPDPGCCGRLPGAGLPPVRSL
ncbi:MAG: Aminodeoxychorismate lyase, partial [uncultured Acidimicrobiales bacterium]